MQNENNNEEVLVVSKRIYDTVEKNDGIRILVDRLWPRGIKKEDAKIDLWAKNWTPSPNLRSWFHDKREERFKEFTEKYQAELKDQKVEIKTELEPFRNEKITLLTANKDIKLSHVPALEKFVKKLLKTK